jgi:hypothetical protein
MLMNKTYMYNINEATWNAIMFKLSKTNLKSSWHGSHVCYTFIWTYQQKPLSIILDEVLILVGFVMNCLHHSNQFWKLFVFSLIIFHEKLLHNLYILVICKSQFKL